MNNTLATFLPLVILVVLMYVLMIKPQQKRDKAAKQMRNSLQVGDEIVTIGGICGKIVKTKEESVVIQVGADKTKMEIMRWAVSQVVNGSDAKSDAVEEDAPKKALPKRLKKSESAESEAQAPEENTEA
ncbi:MAG: preprotein translocase subunit YajC [Firmicutes bacterium]|nr:preprotein translocase subunit YajC [Bacillota bacterium]